jgi:hypothetical protein
METIKLAGNRFPPTDTVSTSAETASEPIASEFIEPVFEPFNDMPTERIDPKGSEDEETKLERRTLVRKLMRYRTVFPQELIDLNLNNLGDKSINELRDLGRDAEYLVSTRRSAKAMRILAGLGVLEASGSMAGLQLHGLTYMASQNEEILSTVDESAIRHEALLEMPPLQRLCISVAQLALAIDARNRQVAVATPTPTQTPPQSTRQDNIAEFADL